MRISGNNYPVLTANEVISGINDGNTVAFGFFGRVNLAVIEATDPSQT